MKSSKRSRIWQPDFPFRPEKCPLFYGWVIVAISTVAWLFSIPGQTMGFSVFTEILIEELGLSRVTLSTAYCLGTVASGLTLPHLGKLLDRYGERRVGVTASLSCGVILVYLSCVKGLAQWLGKLAPPSWSSSIAFILIAIGFYLIRAAAQGTLTMTSRNAMGKWFDHNRGMAMAISGIAVSFGFSIAPKALDRLIQEFGYQGAWLSMGLATILIMAPLAWLFLRDSPEESGLFMDGDSKARAKSANLDMVIHRDYTRSEAVATGSFWIFNLSFAFHGFFGTALTFHIISIGSTVDFSRSEILTLFVPMAAASVSTNLFFGWINPRVRLKYLLVVMNLGCLVGICSISFLNHQLGVLAYVVGNGIAGGGFVSLSGLIWPRFFGRQHLGAISGVNMSSMVMASGLGPLVFGLSYQLTQSYQSALTFSAIALVALSILSLKADNPQRHNPSLNKN